ncbi:MAG: SPASM domain-containing protein [Candidatus Ventricola sp.]
MSELSIMIKPVSGACNMRCQYCFYADVMHNREQACYPAMTPQALETIVRRAMRYADGPVSFVFQGGEPTLAGLPYYQALVQYQRKHNARGLPVYNSVQTNGYALSDEMIAFFAREHFLLGVSLDGDGQTHDLMRRDAHGQPTFTRIRENIARLQRAGVAVNILCVVNEFVAQRPKEVFEALKSYGVLQFIACLDPLSGEAAAHALTENSYLSFLKTTFDLYEAAYRRGKPVSVRSFDNYIGILMGRAPESCAMSGQCGRYYLIESDGGVYPCDFYVLDEWRMGNIHEHSFPRLAQSEVGQRFIRASQAVPEACRACRWYRLCRNGCKRERDPKTGINKWCSVYSAFFAYSVPRMQEMARRLSGATPAV